MNILSASVFFFLSTTLATRIDYNSNTSSTPSDATQDNLLRGSRSIQRGCCSLNFRDCDGQFCGTDQGSCESCDQQPMLWLFQGEITGCLPKWDDCSADPNECCHPAQCVPTTETHSQCQFVPPTPYPSSAPSSPPSPEPTDAVDACCSLNFKDCDGTWCGQDKDSCEICEQNVDVVWLPRGPRKWCFEKWADCTGNKNSCCNPAGCVRVTDEYYQCKPV